MTQPTPRHRWQFHRVGGLDQVSLATGADLLALEQLDPKLWVALSCPVRGLELDARTLGLLDLDKDGRVRVPEVRAAIRWCAARLRDLGVLIPGGQALPLSAIREDTPEGKALLGAARHVLRSLGKADADKVLPADVADTSKVFQGTPFNGDGVVPPESAEDPALRQVIVDAITCAGGVPDRSGATGLDADHLKAFYEALAAHAAWLAAGDAAGVKPAGEGTLAAWQAVQAIKAKADDFFTRCGLAAMDPRGAALLNRSEAELTALGGRDLSPGGEVAALPLARIEPGRALPLSGAVNPAWAGALAALRDQAVAPILGARAELAAADWADLQARLAPFGAWQAKKEGAAVEPLGAARVRALAAGGERAAVEALIARDLESKAEAEAVDDVVRMVHYHRDLYLLLKNFVSFADFYDAGEPAIFQAGTLYLDQRSCELCVRVDDPGAHAGLAALSRMYLAYCECKRPGGEAMRIVACFSQGDADYLMVGRHGLFFDRAGRDWDATIVKVVENPISIRQAFFSPYKKFLRAIEDAVARFAAAKEKESDAQVTGAAGTVTAAATGQKPAPAPAPVDVGKMVGIIAALGVGAGALGTVIGGLVSGFVGLQPWWAKLVAVAGVVLVISGPSMLIAWLKLRQRTLGPVLEANGWAINGRVRVNLLLGRALTELAHLPAGASRSLEDPFEDREARARRRLLYLLVVVVAAALGAAKWKGWWPFGPWPF